jgi:AraC-like DNA-binding protein
MLLSRNYPPSDALAPYIRRHYVFAAELPADFSLVDTLLSENAFVRILIRGDWKAEVSPGQWEKAGPVVLFGANGRPFPVAVNGPFTVAGFAIRPSGWRSLFAQTACDFADTMIPLGDVWDDLADGLWNGVKAEPEDEVIVRAMETAISGQLARIGLYAPDAQMATFEAIARTDSMTRVEDAAGELGMSVRQLERRCLASFGLSPKAILRRSRFLDMATAMRGFSTPNERVLAGLRYFDQSHLNREFKHFAGMTPRRFRLSSTPLFTAGLKLRHEGKALP